MFGMRADPTLNSIKTTDGEEQVTASALY